MSLRCRGRRRRHEMTLSCRFDSRWRSVSRGSKGRCRSETCASVKPLIDNGRCLLHPLLDDAKANFADLPAAPRPVSARADPRHASGMVVGHSPLAVWGLPSALRLRRQLRARRCAAPTSRGGRRVLLRADWVYDDALVRGLVAAVRTSRCSRSTAAQSPWTSTPPRGRRGGAARRSRAPATARAVAPRLADGYNNTLRKREPPYLMPLSAAALPGIEQRVFGGAYKGVTDLVTLYVWPRPARLVTRLCAHAGITPNQVTSRAWCWCSPPWRCSGPATTAGAAGRLGDDLPRHGRRQARARDPELVAVRRRLRPLDRPDPSAVLVVGLDRRPAGGGLRARQPGLVLTVIVAGYVLQRVEEGIFIACFGMEMHVWQRFDSRLRLITARRNPNLLLLSASVLLGRPDLGIVAVAVWTAVSLGDPRAAPRAGGAGARRGRCDRGSRAA